MHPNFLCNIFHCVKTFELESLPETGEITPAMTTIYNIFHCVKIFELESLPETGEITQAMTTIIYDQTLNI